MVKYCREKLNKTKKENVPLKPKGNQQIIWETLQAVVDHNLRGVS
jgi:hypothetical protein